MPAEALVLVEVVAKSIKTCIWIRNKCFLVANSAHEQFRALDQDVESFRSTLVRLEAVLPEVAKRFGSLKHGRALHNDGVLFLKEAENLFGNFSHTLEQCCQLLEDKRIFRAGRSGPWDNLIWNTTTEANVETMRNRIMFHTRKIELLLKPLELAVQAEIGKKMEDVWQTIMDLKEGPKSLLPSLKLEDIPSRAIENIEEHMNSTRNRPDWFKGCKHFKDMPLHPAYDALLFHRESFEKSPIGSPDRYCHLIKAHWMLCRIKDSNKYEEERVGSLFIVRIADEERILHNEYANNDYTMLRGVVEQFDVVDFLIGDRRTINIPNIATTPANGEKLILQLNLPSDTAVEDSRLLVYRNQKHSFRIVQIVPHRDGRGSDTAYPLEIDIPKHSIIPKYAFSPPSGRPEVRVQKPDGTILLKLVFNNVKDAQAFQRAFTNYEVTHENGPVRWVIGVPKLLSTFSAQHKFYGRIQIWDWVPLDPMSSPDSSAAEPGSAKRFERRLIDDPSLISHPSYPGSIAATANSTISAYQSHLEESWKGALPNHYKPAIVLFVSDSRQEAPATYTMLFIELANGMRIVARSCGCKARPLECITTVIQKLDHKGSPKSFEIRELSAASQQDKQKLHTGNVGIFGHGADLGGSRHPQYKDSKIVEIVQVEYLNIDFKTVEERQLFNIQLEEALDRRDNDEKVSARTIGNHKAIAQRVQISHQVPRQSPRQISRETPHQAPRQSPHQMQHQSPPQSPPQMTRQMRKNGVKHEERMPNRTTQDTERLEDDRTEANAGYSSSVSSNAYNSARRQADNARSQHYFPQYRHT